MFIEMLLFLLFILFVWWLYRKIRSDRQTVQEHADPSLQSPSQRNYGRLANVTDELDEDGSDESTGRAVSFEPDGSFRLGGKSSRESLQAYAAKVSRVGKGVSNSPSLSGSIAETPGTVSAGTGSRDNDNDEWRSIASSDVVSDEEREFVASLLRQIDENNRDISLLSTRVRQTDKLREQVSELQARLEEREMAEARHDNSSQVNVQSVTEPPVSRINALSQQLLVRDREIKQLKSSLATAQREARDTRQSVTQSKRREESELQRLQGIEQALADSELKLERYTMAQAAADSREQASAGKDLELRRVRSELEVLKQAQDVSRQQLIERNQRVVELEAHLESYGVEDEHEDKPAPARTFASGAVANAAARAASRSTDPKPQSASLRQLYQPPEECDDLKLVKGIGLKMEQLLNQLGVTTFRQLASFEQQDIEDVSAELKAFPGRIQRDNWVGQAARLHHQFYDDNVSA